ncbi:MAG: DUF7218 family protein [Gaiellaceae bacterium]
MPNKRPSVKNEKQYEKLKEKGMSKERAARIANSPGASSRGGKKSAPRARGRARSREGRRRRRRPPAARAAGPPRRSPDLTPCDVTWRRAGFSSGRGCATLARTGRTRGPDPWRTSPSGKRSWSRPTSVRSPTWPRP